MCARTLSYPRRQLLQGEANSPAIPAIRKLGVARAPAGSDAQGQAFAQVPSTRQDYAIIGDESRMP